MNVEKGETTRFDICCIGHTTQDRVITPDGTIHMPGGTAIYFSSAIAALPVKSALITSLADQDQVALAGLQQTAVRLIVYPSAHTLFFENRYGNNTDERTQRILAVADPFTPEQVTGVEASVYHLGTLLSGDIPPAAIKALAAKGRVSLDVQGYLRKAENGSVVPVDWEEKKFLLPFIHYLKANEAEMAVLTGQSDATAAAQKLMEWGAKEVIFTFGSNGSVIYTADEVCDIPAFAPGVLKDATGCGDTYMAGYLYQRCKGSSIQAAGEFAAAMATLKLQMSGPFRGTEEDVSAVLQDGRKQMSRA